MKEYPSKYRSPDRRYDRSNRQFEHPQYISHDRQNPNQRKRFSNRKNDPAEQLNELLKKAAPELKTRLDEISASQRRLADAEERKAAALEKIAVCFQGGTPLESAPAESEPETVPETVAESEIEPETEPAIVSEAAPESETEPETEPETGSELEPESKTENLSKEQPSTPVQDVEKTVSHSDSTPDSPVIIKATDAQRARVLKIVKQMHKKSATYNQIALRLEEENLPTFSGRGKWHAQTIHRLLKKK